jgi:hypothetical protein
LWWLFEGTAVMQNKVEQLQEEQKKKQIDEQLNKELP